MSGFSKGITTFPKGITTFPKEEQFPQRKNFPAQQLALPKWDFLLHQPHCRSSRWHLKPHQICSGSSQAFGFVRPCGLPQLQGKGQHRANIPCKFHIPFPAIESPNHPQDTLAVRRIEKRKRQILNAQDGGAACAGTG